MEKIACTLFNILCYAIDPKSNIHSEYSLSLPMKCRRTKKAPLDILEQGPGQTFQSMVAPSQPT